MPGLMAVVGQSRADAEDKHERLQSLIHPDIGLAILSDIVGMDLSTYPLDGPLPDAPLTNAQQGRQKLVIDLARRDGLTIRQLYQRIAGSRAHRTICGTASDIANSLEHWYTGGAADGFNILTSTLPDGIADFAALVIPELQRRRLFRSAYEGPTLRENLGLKRPENQFFSHQRTAK